MSFDGNIVRNVTRELNETLLTGRINKIYQLSKYDLLFVVNSKQGKKQLLISNSPTYSRIYITEMTYEKPDSPPAFCMFLRKKLEGGIIIKIQQLSNDRVIIFDIEKRNELGDLVTIKLICEIMGRHSNIIITDVNFKILEAIKHVMPFEGNERTIYPTSIYQKPSTENKINPFDDTKRDLFLDNPDNFNSNVILNNFIGFSPLISEEIMYRFEHSQETMKSIFHHILNDYNPTTISNKRDHFYYIDITHLSGDKKYFETICKALDYYYYNRDRTDITKQKSKDLIKFAKNYIIRLRNKIDKLYSDLKKTDKREILRIKGELIKANLHLLKKGESQLICVNFYDNNEIEINLDEKLTPIENSERYFKKYKKLKASIPHISRQLKESQIELRYFTQLLHQIEMATLKDIEEIKEELESKKYIRKSTKNIKKRKKPNYDTYFDEDNTEILVGKNNIQNEYITHKLAKHNETWFHVKDASGSHVVLRKTAPLTETNIRTAAQLASYFSKLRTSNSVPVDYTEIRYVKKIPGKISSFVSYKNNKTIYIDPDESFIRKLQKK